MEVEDGRRWSRGGSLGQTRFLCFFSVLKGFVRKCQEVSGSVRECQRIPERGRRGGGGVRAVPDEVEVEFAEIPGGGALGGTRPWVVI